MTSLNHRTAVSSLIFKILTNHGDEKLLADAFFSGAFDALTLYIEEGYEVVTGRSVSDDDAESLCSSDDFPVTMCREFGSCLESGISGSCNSSTPSNPLTYAEFVDRYMSPNVPVVIENISTHWPASTLWTSPLPSGGRTVNIDYLSEAFPSASAPVHVTTPSPTSVFGGKSRPSRKESTVKEYCEWWQLHRDASAEQEKERVVNPPPPSDEPRRDLHYLKDWKFTTAFPAYDLYTCPHYFADDWLNAAFPSYKFVYLGPAGTSTRLHADVLRSYSWSSNVVGCKRWHFVPPSLTFLLYDAFGQALAPHLHADEDPGIKGMYPGLRLARKCSTVVVQRTGDTIFVPAGWHHTVENLEDTLSINHNWINGFGIVHSWEKLRSEIEAEMEADREATARRKEEERLAWDRAVTLPETVQAPPPPPPAAVHPLLLLGDKNYDNEASQISGDLALLYIVVSKRVRAAAAPPLSRRDLEACRTVIDGIDRHVKGSGDKHGLAARCGYEGEELLALIDDFLSADPP